MIQKPYPGVAARAAETMRVFADGNETFVYGEWRAWVMASYAAGKVLPPSQFKEKT